MKAAELESNFELRNRKTYRSRLASSKGPTVPLLCTHFSQVNILFELTCLRALATFKHDIDVCLGMPSTREDLNKPGAMLINLERYRVISRTTETMELCHARYNFKHLDYIHKWLQWELAKFGSCSGDGNKNLILLDELRYAPSYLFWLIVC